MEGPDILSRLRDLAPGYGGVIADAVAEIEALRNLQAASEARVAHAIAERIAKRECGETYEGYESSHFEAAKDYARAACSIR